MEESWHSSELVEIASSITVCRSITVRPSLPALLLPQEILRVSANNVESQKFSDRLSVAIFCAILNGSVPSPQPSSLSPTVPRPARLPSSPCPLCSSSRSCSTFSASFMSFHLTLLRSLKSSSLHSGGTARSVSRRVLRGPSKPQRQQHKGLFQAGLGARRRDERGTSQHPSALAGC